MLVINNISSYVGRHYSATISGVQYDWSVSRCDPKVDLYEIILYNKDLDTDIVSIQIDRNKNSDGKYNCRLYYKDYRTLIWEMALPSSMLSQPNPLITTLIGEAVGEIERRNRTS